MKRIITLTIAVLAFGAASSAQAAPIRDCGNWAFTGNNAYQGFWTFNLVYGYTPVFNLTTRSVRCSDARPASLSIMRYHSPPFGSHRNTYWHSFTCRWQWSNGEDWDVRCTRGSQVIHWQGGA